MDTLRGLEKAKKFKYFNFDNFDINEYEHFEQVENGDLNWCWEGKFLAFAGPHQSTEVPMEGYHALPPDHYIPYFKRKNVTLVIRFNKKCYDANSFKRAGIDHAGEKKCYSYLYLLVYISVGTYTFISMHSGLISVL